MASLLNLFDTSPSLAPLSHRQPPFRQHAKVNNHLKIASDPLSYDDGRRWIEMDITPEADVPCDDEDACSAISSIHFAADPDEKPPNKSSKREPISPDDDEPITPRNFSYSFGPVLDISAANRIMEPETDFEDEETVPTYRKPSLRNDGKLLRTLGILPPADNRRRSSIAITPPSSRRSSISTSVDPSSDITWALPEVPNLSPISTTFSLLSSQPHSQPNEYEPSKRKRRSSAFRSVDSLATFLKPGKSYPRNSLFRSSTFSYSTALASSGSVVQPLDPSTPPGLDTVGISAEKQKDKRKRESVLMQDSPMSDLHRLPASLTIPTILEDSQSTVSLTFNYSPAPPPRLQRSSTITLTTSLSSPSDEHRNSLSTQISTLSDLHHLPDSLKGPVHDDETRTINSGNSMIFGDASTSASLNTAAAAPALELPTPTDPYPTPRPQLLLRPLPSATSSLFPPPKQGEDQGETLGTGTVSEEIIEPGAISDSLVSPIVFAPPDGAHEADEIESPFHLITGSGTGTRDKDSDNGSSFDSAIPSPSPSASSLSPKRAEVRPAFGDLMWGGATMGSSKPQHSKRLGANSLDHLDMNSIRSKDRVYLSPATGMTLKRPRTASTFSITPRDRERSRPQPDTAVHTTRGSRRDPRTWVGEWNVEMPDVLKQLRILK